MLLVDEFQDLTPAHLLLVRLLAGPDGCVFGVGDDDQTIYGFNGADPQWLIDFAKYFPDAGEHPLEVNYRCPADVVAAAATLLQHNARRVPKDIRAASDERRAGDRPAGDAVATTVASHHRSASPTELAPADIAVLTRVNSLLAPVQVALGMAGIATHGGVGAEFADRAAVRGSLAWLRLATTTGGLSKVDVGEALRNPSRPLRPNVAGWVAEQDSLDGLRRLAGRLNTPREAERVEAFAADIELLQQLARTGASTAAILVPAARLDGHGLDAVDARHASQGHEPRRAERRSHGRRPARPAAAGSRCSSSRGCAPSCAARGSRTASRWRRCIG